MIRESSKWRRSFCSDVPLLSNSGLRVGFSGEGYLAAIIRRVTTASGHAIVHSDFSVVRASKPAAVVNSPLDVTVNGKSADVLAAVGYPGAVDSYQVNFRVNSKGRSAS